MNFPTLIEKAKTFFGKKRDFTDVDNTIVMSDKKSKSSSSFPKIVQERYNIRRSLGKGAFGIVYLAEDKKIGRLVAIKQLFKSFVKDPDIHERFMQEARIGSQLDHPNIINVFTLEEDNNSACIIMEYLGGGSLQHYMEKNGRIPIESAFTIFRGIMKGLNAAHHVMAIHRDIKPPNILFDHFGVPKISDFGVALLPVDAGGSVEINEKKDKIVGTPRYMSPEQVGQNDEIDARTDIYSAGVVLYEMLTGRKIYEFNSSTTFDEIQKVIQNQEPDPLQGDINQNISQFVMKLIAKSPEDRYATAQLVLNELDKIQKKNIQRDESSEVIAMGGSGPIINSTAAMFEDVIRLLLVDGYLSPPERSELKRRAERLGISDIQARALEDKVRKEMELPALKQIEEYFSFAQELYKNNTKLTTEDKQLLQSKRKGFNIKRSEAMLIEKMAKNVALSKRNSSTKNN